MKHLFITACFVFMGVFGASAQAGAIEKYFNQYMEDENFSVVYVSPKMFSMVTKIAGEEVDDEILDLVSDLKGLRVLTTEHNAMEVYKDAMNKINTTEYEVLVTVRDQNENVRILTKESNDIMQELLLLVGSDSEFVMVSFIGNIDINKLAKMANKLEINGIQHLEKIDKKN